MHLAQKWFNFSQTKIPTWLLNYFYKNWLWFRQFGETCKIFLPLRIIILWFILIYEEVTKIISAKVITGPQYHQAYSHGLIPFQFGFRFPPQIYYHSAALSNIDQNNLDSTIHFDSDSKRFVLDNSANTHVCNDKSLFVEGQNHPDV